MIGRVINRARRLWIMVVSILLLVSVAVAVWIIFSQAEKEIPNKGVFVINQRV
ncbi:MAG: hypothetical protein PHC69_07555 [Ruminiclostridium sp.]|nr:hypothetical protein [Ruminiclostridium sp.]